MATNQITPNYFPFMYTFAPRHQTKGKIYNHTYIYTICSIVYIRKMGNSSSSNGHSTEGSEEVYFDERYLDTNEYGTLLVRSRRVGNSALTHHYLAIKVNDLWRVFERMEDDTRFFSTPSIWGRTCKTIGEVSVREVWEAAKSAGRGKYSLDTNNCNHWTERAVKKLGYTVTLHGVLCICRQ
jgi:hypothetical protein